MNFEIGQIFEGEYPPEAAVFCNSRGDCYIDEIEPIDGQRRFQIVAVPEPTDDEMDSWREYVLDSASGGYPHR